MIAFVVAAALAQPGQVSDATTIAGESPRMFTLELKLGPYTPMADAIGGLAADPATGLRPYTQVFGGTPMLMGELGLEYLAWQKFGTIAGGVSVAYAEKFAKAFVADTDIRANQSTGLRILTIRPTVTYRFDWAALRHKVPLVPYVKAQFVAMPWWILNGGEIETFDGKPGQGVSFGVAGTVGLSIMLDILDQRLARDFDSSVGVNHTYIFAELNVQEMFARTALPLGLSSRHWLFGLAFDL